MPIQLKAKDATLSAIETSYKCHLTPRRNNRVQALENANQQGGKCDDSLCPDPNDDILREDLHPEMNRKCSTKDSLPSDKSYRTDSPEKCRSHLSNKKKNTILSIRKVTLLQEMLDASCRRLGTLLNKIQSEKDSYTNMPYAFSLCDKFAVIQDCIKLSLHLLKTKLSNEIESIRLGKVSGDEEDDSTIQLRFDRTMELLSESEKENRAMLEEMKNEIEHQNIKSNAKDGIIEGLMRSERSLNTVIQDLFSQLNVLKSLSDYSSVNAGLIARFKEFIKIEEELREKERIIDRLNNVIKEYRTQEDVGKNNCA